MKKMVRMTFMLLSILLLSACSALGKGASPAETVALPAVEMAAAPSAAMPATATLANPVTGAGQAALIPTQTSVVIQHQQVPGNPTYARDQKVTDCSTGERIALGATTVVGSGCDDWSQDKLERPVDALNGNYFPVVDIVRASMGTNQAWMFARVELYKDAAGNLPENLSVGVELDTDLDSRGDILILVKGLHSTEWTTEGVQVWQDENGDVGGQKPHRPDNQAGNGYETLLFDAGQGEDADLAWARIDPENGAGIEFAFKPSLLPENQVFAWWTWTMLQTSVPQELELVDSQSESTVWKMDNTCGWIYNSKPSRMLANICEFTVPTATPEPTPTPRSAPGNSCVEPPGGCAALGPGWIFYECQCVLFN